MSADTFLLKTVHDHHQIRAKCTIADTPELDYSKSDTNQLRTKQTTTTQTHTPVVDEFLKALDPLRQVVRMLVQMRVAYVAQDQHLCGHVKRLTGLFNQLPTLPLILHQSVVVTNDLIHSSCATSNRLVNARRQLLHLRT